MRTVALCAGMIAVTLLAGCRDPEVAAADGRILRDGEGCAYFAEPGVGNVTALRRVPDADQSQCDRSRPQGGAR